MSLCAPALEELRRLLAEAVVSGDPEPTAMNLGTIDARGRPHSRIVLLKGTGPDGLRFFTNYTSAKGQELITSGKAALNFHWKSLRRQMRFRGKVAKAPDAVSDAYFAQRHPISRLGAWASNQSQPLKNRAELERKLETMRERFGDNAPRPPYWGGFVLVPSQIELWSDGQNRLHDRFRWVRHQNASEWTVDRVNP
jgi:pyridoxamine 5'-phosphate oxidase